MRGRSIALGVVGVGVIAVAACVGDDPKKDPPPTVIINNFGPEGGASSSSGAAMGTTSSSGAATGLLVHCAEGRDCKVPGEVCCIDRDGASRECVPAGTCAEVSEVACDSADDCGTAGRICCGTVVSNDDGGVWWSSACTDECFERPFCRAGTDCPNSGTCITPQDFLPTGFKICND